MAFDGDEEQLSSKRGELASIDGRHAKIRERLQSKISSSHITLRVCTTVKLRNLLAAVVIKPATFVLQRSVN